MARTTPHPVSRFLVLMCVICICGTAAASETASEDTLRDAVDPLIVGRHRSQFLAITGVDSQLSAEEFEAASKSAAGFVRPFDQFKAMLRFDDNRNGAIDWDEALAYRRDLRQRVLAGFDRNGNSRLDGEERAAALQGLASGKIPDSPSDSRNRNRTRSEQPSSGAAFSVPRVPRPSTPSNNPRQERPDPRRPPRNTDEPQRALSAQEQLARARAEAERNGARRQQAEDLKNGLRQFVAPGQDGPLTPDQEEQLQVVIDQFFVQEEAEEKAQLAKYDANRDGTLDREERQRIWEDARQSEQRSEEVRLRLFDADGDGKITGAEQQALHQAQQRMVERIFDYNGDGRRSAAEQREALDDLLKRFDTNGDGALLDDEPAAMEEYFFRMVR